MALTVFELEADGFSHIATRCNRCQATALLTFGQVRAKLPFLSIWAMSIEQLAARFICDKCPTGVIELEAMKGRKFARGGPEVCYPAASLHKRE